MAHLEIEKHLDRQTDGQTDRETETQTVVSSQQVFQILVLYPRLIFNPIRSGDVN